MKTRKKKIILLIVVGVVIVVGFLTLFTWTGSRSGQVVNAVTGKPIEGAIVDFTWNWGGFFGIGGGTAVSYETITDNKGYYYVPNHFRIVIFESKSE